jgi:hypothetical protein
MTSLFQGLSARFPAFRVPFDFLLALRVAICSTREFEKTRTAKLGPGPLPRRKALIPLICGVLRSHGQITAATQRRQIINGCGASLGLRDSVSNLKVKYGYQICTPNQVVVHLLSYCLPISLSHTCSRNAFGISAFRIALIT